MNDYVFALTVHDNTLIAGGNFSTAGGKISANLAQWTKSCCVGNRGDLNDDGNDANILDLVHLVDFIFRGGSPSDCPEESDMNGDGTPSNLLDLVFLIDYIFRGSLTPPGACPQF